MSKEFYIGKSLVGGKNPCFVIAEIGSNHNNDYDMVLRLIDKAAEAGVDAVKFQTFRASSHYSKNTPNFEYLKDSDTYKLIESLEINRDWHLPLKEYCDSVGVVFLSSPCDSDAIDELDQIGVAAFKLASFDLPDISLIKKMAKKGRPIILSTGMANLMDIQRAINISHSVGNDEIALLQCTSLYPAPVELSNLYAMKTMKQAFGVVTGYSDHTMGEHVCIAAAALGASIIEKHFTLDRGMKGPDHKFAIEPKELKNMVRHIRDVESSISDGVKNGPRPEEKDMFEKGRRSMHAACDIKKGEKITKDMLTVKRPGFGLPPYLEKHLINRVARRKIAKDEWITWEMI